MRWFGARRRTPDPATWQDLWAVLAPLGGTVDEAGLKRVRSAVLALSDEQADHVLSQLAAALAALDTEENARHLVHDPWTGQGRVFARRRFVRVLASVLAGGPVACAQVLADPAQLRGFDRSPDAAPWERVRPDLLGRTLSDAFADREPMIISDATGDLEERVVNDDRGWPALRKTLRAGDSYDFDTFDPEGVWLDVVVDYEDLDDASVTEEEFDRRRTRSNAWEYAGDQATARVLAACGPGPSGAPGTVPEILTGVPLRGAVVGKVALELHVAPAGTGTMTTEVSAANGVLTVQAWASSVTVDAVADSDAEPFLVRRVAGALLDALPDLTEVGRERLESLVHGVDGGGVAPGGRHVV